MPSSSLLTMSLLQQPHQDLLQDSGSHGFHHDGIVLDGSTAVLPSGELVPIPDCWGAFTDLGPADQVTMHTEPLPRLSTPWVVDGGSLEAPAGFQSSPLDSLVASLRPASQPMLGTQQVSSYSW